MIHSELVEIAYKWVLKAGHCKLAFKEYRCLTDEIPDVIGFSSGLSILIECKTSRADFLADAKKTFRINPDEGMGMQRFYCAPKGLIKVEELPKDWGLIEVNEKGKAKCVHKNYGGNTDIRSKALPRKADAELQILYSVLRRLQINGFLKEENYLEQKGIRLYCIKVQTNHDCWIADGDGDPERTLLKENAKTFKNKLDAEKLCKEINTKYLNRNVFVDIF